MMKAYQARRFPWLVLVGIGCAFACVPAWTAGKPAPNQDALVRARGRTLIFRPADLPGFKLIQSGSLDTSGFTHLVVEGEASTGSGWEQKWKRSPSKAHPQAAFVSASVLLCNTSADAEAAVRGKMSGIAALIDWQPRLSTRPPAAADRLYVSSRDTISDGIYHVFGTAGKLAFHLEIYPAQGPLASGDPAFVDRLVRLLLARYTRVK